MRVCTWDYSIACAHIRTEDYIMQDFYAYQFFLCFFVFVVLTAIFTWMVIYYIKVNCKLIRYGDFDEKIKTEYMKKQAKKESIFGKIMDKVTLVLFTAIFVVLFVFGVGISATERSVVGDIPSLKVVQSGSMSYVNEYNKYVKADEVTDSIQMFDLITVHKLPNVEDLKVNDIVLYELDGLLLVHRIVGIELPNLEHPDEIHFLLQGDANEFPDKFPVKYEQMKGIYLGERIPFVGTFINFLQSPAGYLCMLLVVFAVFALPFMEKKIEKAMLKRLIEISFITEDGAIIKAQATIEINDENSALESVEDKYTLEEVQQQVGGDEIALTSSPQILSMEPSTIKQGVGLDEEAVVVNWYNGLGRSKTFKEKKALLNGEILCRYNEIVKELYRIKGLQVYESKSFETYKKGRTPIVKFAIKGKSLYVYLALNPADYENSKYVFDKANDSKAYKDYPMKVKVSSDRQVKWVNELINQIAKNNVLFQYAISTLITIKGERKTFNQKLKEISKEMLERYNYIKDSLASIQGVKAKLSKKHVAYKKGAQAVAKLKIIGKTLNVYINLNPKAYKKTKYKFIDVSSKPSYANYPMRVKVSSNRQAKWVVELINKCVDGGK